MADNNVSEIGVGDTGFISQLNQYFDALKQVFYPRNSAGAVSDLAGSLGDSTRRWLNVFSKVLTLGETTSTLEITQDQSAGNESYIAKIAGTEKLRIYNNGFLKRVPKTAVSDNANAKSNTFIYSTGNSGASGNNIVSKTITTNGGPVRCHAYGSSEVANRDIMVKVNFAGGAIGATALALGVFYPPAGTHSFTFKNSSSVTATDVTITLEEL